MIIKYYVREVYGKPLMYLVDEKQAEAVRVLTGRETLTKPAMKGLIMLGFEFEQIIRPNV